MKHINPLLHTAAALVASATLAFSQGGPLTPPAGVPAPTMKTLDQIEPRTPLVAGAPGVMIDASGLIMIIQSGSYYLTENLDISSHSSGIIVDANGVTVDLMGHSIRYTGGGTAEAAIFLKAEASNVTIQNGHILSTTTHDGSAFTIGGFIWGVYGFNTSHNVIVRNLSIHGVSSIGITITGTSSLVENCSVHIVGGPGISTTNGIIKNCIVQTSGWTGILGHSVIDCRVNDAMGTGIYAFIVANSRATSSGYDGIFAQHTITGSYGQSTGTLSSSRGISCLNGTVTASHGIASGGAGIIANTVNTSLGESSGNHGIEATASVTGSYGQSTSTSSSHRGILSNGVATSSRGTAAGGQGIHAPVGSVSQSYGESFGTTSSARGIEALIVSDSRGHSTNASGGEGLRANTHAMNSSGQSAGASGLYANRAATNCYGYTNFTSTAAHGISSNGTVNGSYGWSNGSGGGDGINASVVSASYGQAGAGARHGINARIVDSSRGYRPSQKCSAC